MTERIGDLALIEKLDAEVKELHVELERFELRVRDLVVGMSNRLTLGDTDGARAYLAQWAETNLR